VKCQQYWRREQMHVSVSSRRMPNLKERKLKYLARHEYSIFMQMMYVCMCMYVYSRGGPQTGLAPRPSLIYYAHDGKYILI
jgi:hypothetical protein